MLQSAPAIADYVDEHVSVIRNFAPKFMMGRNDFFKILGSFLSVPVAGFVHIDQRVIYASNSKRIQVDIACHDRIVDKFVVVPCNVLMWVFAFRKCCCRSTPIARKFQADHVGPIHLL